MGAFALYCLAREIAIQELVMAMALEGSSR